MHPKIIKVNFIVLFNDNLIQCMILVYACSSESLFY